MKIFITGGFGFIGSKLANALSDAGDDVIVPARKTSIPCTKLRDNINVIRCDSYTDPAALSSLDGIDVIYHLANQYTPADSNINIVHDVNSNLVNTLQLLSAAKLYDVRRVVYVSSGGTVYGNNAKSLLTEEDVGNPICSYGLVKKAVEGYLHLYNHLYGMEFNVLRLANAYGVCQRLGTTQGAISAFIYKILTNQDIEIWGDGTIIRDYVYISDVVDALVKAGNSDVTNRIFNIGCGIGHSLNDIIDALRIEFNDREVNVRYAPGRMVDVPINVLDISRARSELFWQPHIDLTNGISLTSKWARSII